MSAAMFKVLTHFLPLHVKMFEWELVYSINRDGYSPLTFFKQLKRHENCVLIIKDNSGQIFGAYTTEAWHYSKRFYGTGESFVFTFHEDEDLSVFMATGDGD